MSQTTNEVINPQNQYTMEKERYMLILNDKYIYRFKEFKQAEHYAAINCHGSYEYYIIIDTELDIVLYSWSY